MDRISFIQSHRNQVAAEKLEVRLSDEFLATLHATAYTVAQSVGVARDVARGIISRQALAQMSCVGAV